MAIQKTIELFGARMSEASLKAKEDFRPVTPEVAGSSPVSLAINQPLTSGAGENSESQPGDFQENVADLDRVSKTELAETGKAEAAIAEAVEAMRAVMNGAQPFDMCGNYLVNKSALDALRAFIERHSK